LDEEPAAAGVEGPPSAAQVLTDDAGRAGDGAQQSATPILADEQVAGGPEPTTVARAGGAVSRPLYRWLSWLVPVLAWTGSSAYYYGNFLANRLGLARISGRA